MSRQMTTLTWQSPKCFFLFSSLTFEYISWYDSGTWSGGPGTSNATSRSSSESPPDAREPEQDLGPEILPEGRLRPSSLDFIWQRRRSVANEGGFHDLVSSLKIVNVYLETLPEIAVWSEKAEILTVLEVIHSRHSSIPDVIPSVVCIVLNAGPQVNSRKEPLGHEVGHHTPSPGHKNLGGVVTHNWNDNFIKNVAQMSVHNLLRPHSDCSKSRFCFRVCAGTCLLHPLNIR